MTKILRIVYLFDPLCGWCYGVSANLQQLARYPGFAVEPAPVGLFAGSGSRPMSDSFAVYAWKNDQRIARLSGQVFSKAYRENVLTDSRCSLDSGPATLALTAVAQTDPTREIEALREIQLARYVNGLDVTDTTTLANILSIVGLQVAARRFVAGDADLLAANQQRMEAARIEMQRFNVEGVPMLIVGEGRERYLIGATELLGNVDTLIAKLQAPRVSTAWSFMADGGNHHDASTFNPTS